MKEVPNPAPKKPMDDSEELSALDELSLFMAEMDVGDSLGLTDSAVGMILGCVDETDSTVKAAQLEAEMVKSLAKLEKATPDDLGAEPPTPKD